MSSGVLTPLTEILSKYSHSDANFVNFIKIGFGIVQNEFPLYEKSECEEIQKFINAFLAEKCKPKNEADSDNIPAEADSDNKPAEVDSDNKPAEADPGQVRKEIRVFGNLFNI